MEKDNESKMGIGGLLRSLLPYVTPYRWLLVVTLVLTFLGSLMAQVNAVVLDRAVDSINALLHIDGGFQWSQAAHILIIVSAVLLGKEVLSALITFGQRIFGEKIRINVSRDLSLRVVDRILQFRMAYFSQDGNEPGKLQTRIDRGVMSLSNTVKNFFIDTSAFSACPQLHKVTLPASLTALADFVFDDGTHLDTIILLCSVPPSARENIVTEFAATLIVPCGTADTYRQHETWGRFANIVENCDGIEDIESNDFHVYVRDGRIIVEGVDVETVTVYDIMGRPVLNHILPTGVYMVQVGNYPARKVVIFR